MGPNSGLHIIILDQFDAIETARGYDSKATHGYGAVLNTVMINMNCMEPSSRLNNIFIIGMTTPTNEINKILLNRSYFGVSLYRVGLFLIPVYINSIRLDQSKKKILFQVKITIGFPDETGELKSSKFTPPL